MFYKISIRPGINKLICLGGGVNFCIEPQICYLPLNCPSFTGGVRDISSKEIFPSVDVSCSKPDRAGAGLAILFFALKFKIVKY